MRVEVRRSRCLGFGSSDSRFYFVDLVGVLELEASGGSVVSLPVVVVVLVHSKSVLRCGEEGRASS